MWSRPNAFGHGVPFRFPSTPDTGPGLTDLGLRLVRECNRLRIVVDVSHLTERGFRDVAATTTAPLDGRLDPNTPIEQVLRHFDHLVAHAGEGGVGFGTDFDGAMIPDAVGDAAGLPRVVDAMRAHGYGEALVEKLCWRNWLRVLERTWG